MTGTRGLHDHAERYAEALAEASRALADVAQLLAGEAELASIQKQDEPHREPDGAELTPRHPGHRQQGAAAGLPTQGRAAPAGRVGATRHPEPRPGGTQMVTEPARLHEILDTVFAGASHEILAMHSDPADGAEAVAAIPLLTRAAGSRGVYTRWIHSCDTAATSCAPERLRLIGDGLAGFRISPRLPFQLFLIDGSLAAVLRSDGSPAQSLMLLQDQPVVNLLRGIFDFHWQAAEPLGANRTPGPGSGRPTSQELTILRLLAEGRKDDAIARELGISPRTHRRLVSALFDELAVDSRFQAGAVAQARGWLDGTRLASPRPH